MRLRLNLEITGIAALGIALLLAVALVAPIHSGALGAGTAHALHAAFGWVAALVPVLVAILGSIVFLEINVPRMIATLGFASLSYFLIIDAYAGVAGGAFGRLLRIGLEAYVGSAGALVVLALLTVALTVWIGNLEVKRVIGVLIAAGSRCAGWIAAASARKDAGAGGALATAARPGSLREAFHCRQHQSKREQCPALAPLAAAERCWRR